MKKEFYRDLKVAITLWSDLRHTSLSSSDLTALLKHVFSDTSNLNLLLQ